MPEPDETKNIDKEDVEDNDKLTKEAEIAEKLGTLIEHQSGDQKLLAKLVANPQIRAIIEAEQRGQKVTLSMTEEKESTKPLADLSARALDFSDVEGLEDLPRNEFAKTIVGKTVDSISTLVEKQLDGLKGELKRVNDYIGSQENNAVSESIAQARKDHKDFDTYGKEMLALHKQFPEMHVERLYRLAKAEHGDKVPAKVDTERPTPSGGRPSRRSTRKEPIRPGRAGMEQLLDESLETFDFDELV